MDKKPMPDFKEAMCRVQLVTGCGTQQELASLLGIRQSSISDAKKRGNIPADWLLTLWRKTGINPDWILTGQGARMLCPADSNDIGASTCIYIAEIRPPETCSIEELATEIIRRVTRNSTKHKY